MSREMKHSGIPWIGEVPKSWEVVRNKNVFSNSKTLVGENWNNTQLLSLTTKGIKPIAIGSTSGKVPDSYETYQVVEKNNLVMCLFDLDCSAVFSGLSPIFGMISPAYKALTVKEGYYPDFYAKWFEYIFDGRKFMFLSKNIRYSLTYDEFAALQIVAPSLSEQQKIAEFLDKKCGEVDEMIALQEQIIEELKAYKQSVITEVVTKGLNPNVPMKDSGIEWIGEIPEHWESARIKNLSTMISKGATPHTIDKDAYEGNVRFIKCENISNNKLVNNRSYYISPQINETMKRSQLAENDILFVIAGATIGKTAIVKKDFLPSNTNQAVSFIRLKNAKNVKFLWYVLQSNVIQAPLWLDAVQSAQPNLSMEDLGNFNITIPIVDEQQSIANYLDKKCGEIDELISIKQQKIESLKEYKKSIIYEYVTGKKEVV